MSGFVSIRRSAFDHPLFRGDMARLGAWAWMIGRACWRQQEYDIRGKTITLDRGQFCASRAQLAKEWGWSPSAVERFLTRLETEQMIGRETGQGKSIITIRNYCKYQTEPRGAGQPTGQATGHKSDSNRTAKEQGNKGTSILLSEDNRRQAVDLVKAIFDSGVPVLMADGATEKQARSLLGKLRAEHGDPVVLDALARCEVERPSELRSWLVAHCGGKKKGNGNGRQGNTVSGPAERVKAAMRGGSH